MFVLSYRAQSRRWYLKKKCFLEISRGKSGREFRFFHIFFKKSEMKKLNGARFWKGRGGSFVPPPHLVVKSVQRRACLEPQAREAFPCAALSRYLPYFDQTETESH